MELTAPPNSPCDLRDCLLFGTQFAALSRIPLFYVFDDLGVLTPAEVTAYNYGTYVHNGAYYLVASHHAHTFDDVFDSPNTWRQAG